jgi:thiosulfate/3-mercaptopyruvate sulfurtransferase
MSGAGRQAALVTPEWLASHSNDPNVRLIEIAGMGQEQKQAYTAGHLPGAVCWSWKEMLWDSHKRDFPTPPDFAQRLGAAGIGNDTTVVFYGEGIQFGVYAWWTFRYCGHANVCILDGARYRWKNEGRPLVTDVPAAAPATVYRPVARNENMRVLRDELMASLGKPGQVILDGRSDEEYRGERVNGPGGPDVGALRYGRIPGAKHLYFEDLMMASDKRFKPIDEIRALFEARGGAPERNIIAYCRMSHRATVLYFALTELLRYPNVRIYDGSWTEWGNLVGVPVER